MWTLALAVIFLVQETAFALPDDNVLTSPDFPNNYPENTNTEQTVSVPDGYNILITFQEFQLETYNSCGHDYLQICDKNKMKCGTKLCGTSLPDPITFPASTVKIVFHSDGSNSMKGFRLSYKKVQPGWEQVTDLNKQIPEFLFDCLTKKHSWISPCSELREYLMIFDSQGNFFQEKTNQRDNSKYLRASIKKVRYPTGMQVIEIDGHPSYIFQLEQVDQKKGTFYIGTNRQLLVAGNEINSSLLLREDHCGKDSSASATESPVTAITSNATASPEPSVTIASITTVASTESPVTAIAISTPSPNIDYGCNQAQWRLWKVDGRFLLIESANKPGFFLNVDSSTHKVMLGMPEKLTGIHTSFISHMTLDRSAGEPAEPGIGAEAYGDVVVHYFGRNGSQHSGYICDYEWGQESADSVCKHLGFGTGIPTYDGRYSSTNTPEYAVSEVICDSENLEECKVRTICGPSSSCLSQNSMKAFGGKGYACNRGSATDVAGVVCGDQAQILNVLKEEVTCNRTSLVSDRKSVASMSSIMKQIKTVGSSMFQNKHWSEYLLPMPMAVSLIAALLLVSSQNDRAVELVKPAVGEWVYLKHIYLQPNLLLLSQHVEENFVLSNNNMGVIKVNTKEIHRNMKQALRNAFSSSSYDYKRALPRNLKRIADDAVKNKELTEEVCAAFNNTKQIINELVQALQSTQDYQINKKADTEKALKVLNTTYENDKNVHEEKKLKKKEYDAAVKTSRKAYFDAAKAAMNTKCVEANSGDGYGDAECKFNCNWREPIKTDECKPNKTETVCTKWNDPTCEEFESKCVDYGTTCIEFSKVCTGGFETICSGHKMVCARHGPNCIDLRCAGIDGGCCTEGNPCGHGDGDCDSHSQCLGDLECGTNNCQWGGDGDDCCTGGSCEKECLKYEKICQNPKVVCKKEEQRCLKQESVCKKEEQVCKRTAPQKTCNTYMHVCTEFVYDPAVSGSYCEDDRGQIHGKCTSCKWIAEVQKTLNNVMDITVKMQSSVMNDETSYSEVAHVTDDLVKQVATIDQDVQNYQKWKSISQLVPPVDNATQAIKIDNGTKTMNNESQTSNLFIDANRNIDSMLKLMKLSVDLKIALLSQMKLPIAKKLSHYTLDVKGLLENLITRKVKKVVEMTENEKMSIANLYIKGKTILMEANKLKAKHEVEIKKSSVGGDAKTGEQASILMENLSNRHKTEKVIESLANRMSNAIREMFKQDLEKQDINTVITKLIGCYRYLNFLNEQWLDLREFFMKLTNILDRMQKTIEEMSVLYSDMHDININRTKLINSKTFKEDLKTSVVKALSNNMFVRRVAHFYTKISEDGEEDGLLTKMALIGTYLQKIDDPKMYEKIKKYIDDESVMMQDRIKLEVSKVEAKANDEIMKDILSIKNDLACNLKDVDSLSDETVIAVVSYQKARNDQVNVNKTSISEASPASCAAETPSVLDGVGNDLKKTFDGIENNKCGYSEDYDTKYNDLGNLDADYDDYS